MLLGQYKGFGSCCAANVTIHTKLHRPETELRKHFVNAVAFRALLMWSMNIPWSSKFWLSSCDDSFSMCKWTFVRPHLSVFCFSYAEPLSGLQYMLGQWIIEAFLVLQHATYFFWVSFLGRAVLHYYMTAWSYLKHNWRCSFKQIYFWNFEPSRTSQFSISHTYFQQLETTLWTVSQNDTRGPWPFLQQSQNIYLHMHFSGWHESKVNICLCFQTIVQHSYRQRLVWKLCLYSQSKAITSFFFGVVRTVQPDH